MPPRWLTPVPDEDIERGNGVDVGDFIETMCVTTKRTVSGPAGSPLELMDWQWDLLGRLYARREDGRRRHRTALIGVPRKNGKALDVATPIPTPDGWVAMGDLEPGDYVFGLDGQPVVVEAATDVMHGHDCFRVHTSDGASIVADADHQWRVRSPWSSWVTKTTRDLAAGVYYGRRSDRKWRLPLAGALQTKPIMLPIDPYVLGQWLGDGTSKNGAITSADPETWQEIEAAGYVLGPFDARGWTRTVYGLQPLLRAGGLLRNKHIPHQYKIAAEPDRWALLAGLIDSDGHVHRHPNGSASVEVTLTDRKLIGDVVELVRSLGIKTPDPRESEATIDGRVVGRRWRVQFVPPPGAPCSRLPRKRDKLPTRQRGRSATRTITAITPVDSVPVRCIQVDGGLFLAGRHLVPTHNSGLASGLALYHLLMEDPGAEVYSCAADRLQAKIVFSEASKMIEANPELAAMCRVYRDAIEVTATHSVYRALSSESYTKEGLSPNVVLMDEVHALPRRDLWDVMQLAMGARIDPLMLGFTTAGVRTDVSGGDSICYQLFDHLQAVSAGETDDPTFYGEWWASDAPIGEKQGDIDANPSYGVLIDPEDFVSVKKRTPEGEYLTKRRNLFVASSHNWFPEGVFEGLADESVEIGQRPVVLGFDGSVTQDCTAIVGCTADDSDHLFVVEVWERPRDAPKSWTVPSAEVLDTMRRACADLNVREIAIDPAFWRERLEMFADEGYPVVEFSQQSANMVQATAGFQQAVIDGALSHDGDPYLRTHVRNCHVEPARGGIKVRKQHPASSAKIDSAVAAIMARQRARYWAEQPEPVRGVFV